MNVSLQNLRHLHLESSPLFTFAYFLMISMVSVICPTRVSAQKRLLNKVEKDCKCPEFTKQSGFSELTPIENSPNEIEIRLTSYSLGPMLYFILTASNGTYKGVHYRSKSLLSGYREPKPGKSPYYRYLADSSVVDTVISKLIRLNIASWKNPGFKITDVPDLGIMQIQYKIYNHTGSYNFQPPDWLLKRYPENQAYQELSAIIKAIQSLPYTDVARSN